ncbi:protein unzipped [Anthonomus grandis grandis]|uniref:protein unzipped n=1 Tax=Anthonomus grandis grandis TaxID=2921223 RepID=UPI00216689A5|nr:protein unzipped [Anthonomus grandis grandis]
MLLFYKMLLMGLTFLVHTVNAADPVHVLSYNFEQTVTSTTLQWVSTDGSDPSVLKYAVVGAYQITDDSNEPSLPDDNDILKSHQEPIYICRAKLTGIWVTGQLRPNKRACVATLYRKVESFKQFEVLYNIDHSARLSWVSKDKYTNIPQGAITSGENVLRTFVGRKPSANPDMPGHMTHYIGTLNPSEVFGTYHVVDENNTDIASEDGQILVETEPISYEIKNIRYKPAGRGRRFPKRKMVWDTTVLKNDESGVQKVESVMTYEYEYFLSWGKGHGLLTGLPFTVFLPKGDKVEGVWGLPKPEKRVETVPVDRNLDEGTAVNVTLVGNFTETEVPYSATVVAIYKDGERLNFTIEDVKRENKVIDVAFDFSPMYFLHNNSLVPTTTPAPTTTTSTTTTQSTTSSGTTQEISPISLPEVVVRQKQEPLHSESKKTDENSSGRVASLEKKPDKKESSGAAGVFVTSLVLIGSVVIVGLRVV